MKKRIVASAAAGLLSIATLAGPVGPAGAQPVQEGLVNVNISNLDVAVPIGIAANICDVRVAVLAQLGPGEDTECTNELGQEVTFSSPEDDGAPQQNGLVNVNASDIQLFVPIGVLANICDVDVAVLAELPEQEDPVLCNNDEEQVITPAA
jgi:hypothetical protein